MDIVLVLTNPNMTGLLTMYEDHSWYVVNFTDNKYIWTRLCGAYPFQENDTVAYSDN